MSETREETAHSEAVMLATMIGALLAKHRVIDAMALEDPEGYDNARTVTGILMTVHDLIAFVEDRIKEDAK